MFVRVCASANMLLIVCACVLRQLLFCCNVILGVMKRCQWPDDPDVARRGGFVVAAAAVTSENGAVANGEQQQHVVYRNPATPHLMELLDNVLALMRLIIT